MTPSTTPVQHEKSDAILAATCEIIAERGLHNTPISAIARKAGIAAGTLYLYFENKDVLINEVYLYLNRQSYEYVTQRIEPTDSFNDWMRDMWYATVQWQLQFPNAFNVIQQCETSGILQPETIQRREDIESPYALKFEHAIAEGFIKNLPRQVVYALFMGPITILTHLQAKGEIELTEEILDQTFTQLQRAIQS